MRNRELKPEKQVLENQQHHVPMKGVNDSEVLPQLKGSHASAMAARRQRQHEEEQLRKEARDSRLAKEYAQTMMEWGRMVQD